jgi:hypothetical protein
MRGKDPQPSGPVTKRTWKSIAAKLRSWRVILIRSRGEYLGSVEASDCEQAEAAAVKHLS